MIYMSKNKTGNEICIKIIIKTNLFINRHK